MVLAQDIIYFKIPELGFHVVQLLLLRFFFAHRAVKPFLADLRFERVIVRVDEVLSQNSPRKLPFLLQFHFIYVPDICHLSLTVVQKLVYALQRCRPVELELFLLFLKQLILDTIQPHLVSF